MRAAPSFRGSSPNARRLERAFCRYVFSEDASSLTTACLLGSLRTSVGARLLAACDASDALFGAFEDARSRLAHFEAFRKHVAAARDALGVALVADPRTPALSALRLSLDWDGGFFSNAASRGARLSLS